MISIRGSPSRFFSLTIGLALACAVILSSLAVPIAASAAPAYRASHQEAFWPASTQVQPSGWLATDLRQSIDLRVAIKVRDSPALVPVSRVSQDGPSLDRDEIVLGAAFVPQPRLATAGFHRRE